MQILWLAYNLDHQKYIINSSPKFILYIKFLGFETEDENSNNGCDWSLWSPSRFGYTIAWSYVFIYLENISTCTLLKTTNLVDHKYSTFCNECKIIDIHIAKFQNPDIMVFFPYQTIKFWCHTKINENMIVRSWFRVYLTLVTQHVTRFRIHISLQAWCFLRNQINHIFKKKCCW